MKRLIVLIAIAALSATGVYSQGPTESPRQVKAGDVIQLGATVNLRVTKSAKSPFTGVKVQGSPLVVVLEFDGGKSASVSYKLTPDPKSDLYLTSGAQKIAPLAMLEDFPSWGADNDKEIEVLDPKDSLGIVTLNFAQKGTVSLLFDVPAAQPKTPQKFSLMLQTIKPTKEKFSFVVNL